MSNFDWHHVSLIVDETHLSNALVRRSIESVFTHESNRPNGYPIYLDVQSFTYRNYEGEIVNKTIDFRRILQSSSRVARGEYVFPNYICCMHLLIDYTLLKLICMNSTRDLNISGICKPQSNPFIRLLLL